MDNAHNASSSTNAPSSSSSSRTTNAQPSSSSTVRLAPSSSNSASMTHSASATGPSFEIPISHEPITIEGSLAAHASYADPTRAALETVIADRNTFSAQNVQLWNHMRKQRSYHIHLVKDVDRLRHERDVLRHKLSKYEKTGREPHSSERPLKATASSSRVNGTDTPTGPAIEREDRPSSTSRTIPDPRAGVARHKSDETHAASQRATLTYEGRSQTPTLPYTRAQAPMRGEERERSNTQPTNISSDVVNGNTSATDAADQVSMHHPRPVYASEKPTIDVEPARHTSSPTPLIIPTRMESLPSSTTSSTDSPNSGPTRPLNFAARGGHESGGSSKSSPVNNTVLPTINVPPSQSHSDSNQTKQTVASESLLGSNLNPHYSTQAPRYTLSRESRITLPDEARRYITTMPESPLQSPKHSGPSTPDTPQPSSSSTAVDGERTRVHSTEEVERGQDGSPRPFLELDDEESENDRRISDDMHREKMIPDSDSEIDPERTDDVMVDFGYQRKRSDIATDQMQTPRVRIPGATADQFPLPPSSFVNATRGPNSPTTNGMNGLSAAPSVAASSSWASNITSTSTNELIPENNRDSFMPPSITPAATFRQMPLLNTDLKNATVEVVGSHIRPNDRGREVLCFVIGVNVVGKEGWTIEKFYSDVLALDARLRSRCSRSTLKKIAPLPDSKLFKDNAPAKVDHRKQMLQAYLQSIMQLPIKDKNEIIVFFSTDVCRERSPVARRGYKEGYLTKRGKNFGGWKTRFFMLEGPVLEYYESRGGTHLGSIQITGARIGRQQKSNDKRDSDDENEFRHAFLIIEAKKGPTGQNLRHVLCAESDQERDSWVDMLVRYVNGSYTEEPGVPPQNPPIYAPQNGMMQPRTSTSSSVIDLSSTPTRRALTKDLITKTSAVPIPISQLAHDPSNAKFFQTAPLPDNASASSPIKAQYGPSPVEVRSGAVSDDGQLSSSLPTSSSLDAAPGLVSLGQRANSELGYYPDLVDQRGSLAPEQQPQQRIRERSAVRQSFHPSLSTVMSSPTERSPSPEPSSTTVSLLSTQSPASSGRGQVKISGPMGGQPIPAGILFGAKDHGQDHVQPGNDRERKAKSRTFWGFGRQPAAAADKVVPMMASRAVFGVPLEQSLAVSQIANLPAIVFRCIQYLETKKADQEEGIYRLSGSSAVIKSLKDRFNLEGDVNLIASDEYWDPHAIAGLLKSFLRELPASLLTRELHLRFLGIMDFVDPSERVRELQELISQLPLANYSLLRALTAHLILIVQNSNVNKMTMRNVGIVFSPTLGIPAGVFSLMLAEFNRVFNVDGEGVDSPVEEEAGAPSPKRLSGISRRNSKQYTDAAADQLLGLTGRSLPATEESQSDDGDEISVHDESGAETTEADTAETEGQTIESSADSTLAESTSPVYQEQLHPPQPSAQPVPNGSDVPRLKVSRASNVAASIGLNINVGGTERRPRAQGLPTSPRPVGYSPLSTPTSASGTHASPSTPK